MLLFLDSSILTCEEYTVACKIAKVTKEEHIILMMGITCNEQILMAILIK